MITTEYLKAILDKLKLEQPEGALIPTMADLK